MKTFSKLGMTTLAALGLAAIAGTQAQAQGTIYVEQVGATGSTTALTSAGTAIFLNQLTTSGTSAAATINLTTAGGNTVVDSGTAGSEGGLTQSGSFLTFAGYDAAVGTAAVATSSAPRGVGIYNVVTGAVDTSTSLTDAYTANNIRTAVTTDGVNIFTAGTGTPTTSAGIRQTTDGATKTTQVESASTNTRYVGAYNGSIYFSTGSATGVGAVGIYQVNPANAATPIAVVSDGVNLASPYDFAFTNNGSTLYVADSTKGLVKYTQQNGVFTFVTSFNTGITGGLYGLASGGTDANGNNILYAITGGSTSATAPAATSLVSLDDTGTGAAFTTLATAPTNTAFRGVAFIGTPAAAPEPSGIVAMLIGMGALGMSIARRRTASSAA